MAQLLLRRMFSSGGLEFPGDVVDRRLMIVIWPEGFGRLEDRSRIDRHANRLVRSADPTACEADLLLLNIDGAPCDAMQIARGGDD